MYKKPPSPWEEPSLDEQSEPTQYEYAETDSDDLVIDFDRIGDSFEELSGHDFLSMQPLSSKPLKRIYQPPPIYCPPHRSSESTTPICSPLTSSRFVDTPKEATVSLKSPISLIKKVTTKSPDISTSISSSNSSSYLANSLLAEPTQSKLKKVMEKAAKFLKLKYPNSDVESIYEVDFDRIYALMDAYKSSNHKNIHEPKQEASANKTVSTNAKDFGITPESFEENQDIIGAVLYFLQNQKSTECLHTM